MRCTKCNVDLGENYTVCPLCGSNAENAAPLIPDQRTAEYPVLNRKKQRPDAFVVFLIILAAVGAISLVFCLVGAFDKTIIGCSTMCVAGIWAAAFRPFFVKQLYFGNYLAIAVLPFSALSVFIQKVVGYSSGFAFSIVVPCLFSAAILAMLVGAVFVRSTGKRAAPYGVLFAAAGIIGSVYCVVSGCGSSCAWLCETGVAVLTVVVTLVIYREKAAEELKAKFSV